MTAVSFDRASFSYAPDVHALDAVTLQVEPGQVVCVLGGNGSGKSTLARHMGTLLAPDEGTVTVLGLDTADLRNRTPIRSQVGMVFQNPDDQIVSSLVEDDVAFGPQNLALDPADVRTRVTDALAAVELEGFERRPVDQLSGGQRQRVAIAGALAMRPRVLVFDEADSMLDPRGRARLARFYRASAQAGIAVVVVTHFVDQAALADRVVLMSRGRIAAEGRPAEVLADADLLESLALEAPLATRLARELATRGVRIPADPDPDAFACTAAAAGADAADVQRALVAASGLSGDFFESENGGHWPAGRNRQPAVAQTATPVLTFRDATFRYEGAPGDRPALAGVSFELDEGRTLGVVGATGSGKSTLVQLAGGLARPTHGAVVLPAGGGNEAPVGTMFQYPEHQLFAATVLDDVSFGPANLGLSPAQARERAREALALVGLDADAIGDRSPFSLSGGQQRLVAFAGILALRPRVLVLDEPTAGLDPHAKRDMLQLLDNLRRDRKRSIVIASHDMDAVARLCDRVAVLGGGVLQALGPASEMLRNEELLRENALEAPQAIRFARAFQRQATARRAPA